MFLVTPAVCTLCGVLYTRLGVASRMYSISRTEIVMYWSRSTPNRPRSYTITNFVPVSELARESVNNSFALLTLPENLETVFGIFRRRRLSLN